MLMSLGSCFHNSGKKHVTYRSTTDKHPLVPTTTRTIIDYSSMHSSLCSLDLLSKHYVYYFGGKAKMLQGNTGQIGRQSMTNDYMIENLSLISDNRVS